jgi:hypothetical protein
MTAALVCLVAAAACGPGAPPRLADLDDVSAQVGAELAIALRASRPTTDSLEWSWSLPAIADLRTRPEHPSIETFSDGTAVFRWTPLARDVGQWHLDFSASDGRAASHESIRVTVMSGLPAASEPAFREPAGSGTTLDLAVEACFRFDLVVDDPAVAQVTIGLADPGLPGATLTRTGPSTAHFEWCPTPAQAIMSRFAVTFTADDGTNPQVAKTYVLVVLPPPEMGCAGQAPAVEISPPAMTMTGEQGALVFKAHVTDPIGIHANPLLYYATTAPADPPDLAQLTTVEMTRWSGDAHDGQYIAIVLSAAAASGSIYYLVVASDADGPCVHRTETQVFTQPLAGSPKSGPT